MDFKIQECLFEGSWYEVVKLDYAYQVAWLKTGTGSARIHFCYIEDMREKKDDRKSL